MKFREFISENKEVHHVMAFGRMSPPTTGHEVLVNKVKDVAKSVGGNHSVVLSHTQDKDKNPLSSADKLKHAKRFFSKTNLSTSSKDSPTFLSHAEKLHKQGVTHLHMLQVLTVFQNIKRNFHNTMVRVKVNYTTSKR